MKLPNGLIIAVLVAVSSAMSCRSTTGSEPANVSRAGFDTILNDMISIRALLLHDGKIWYGADKGRIGYIDPVTHSRGELLIEEHSEADFRSIGQNGRNIFVVNAGTPAIVWKVDLNCSEAMPVYRDDDPKVFFDSMMFSDENSGMAIGDPKQNCLTILITRDGGESWREISCTDIPKNVFGEAAFAASNTNVKMMGANAWIFSGGVSSRVFYSDDFGQSWTVSSTPIVQGGTMTGIFSGDFYNPEIGIAAGGNYEKPDDNNDNIIISRNGGRSWDAVKGCNLPGYVSCVQFLPDGKGKEIITVGATGVHYTFDQGKHWTKLSSDPDLYTIRLLDRNTAYAAGRGKIVKITLHRNVR